MSKKNTIIPIEVIAPIIELIPAIVLIPIVYDYLTGCFFYKTSNGTSSIVYRQISFFRSCGIYSILNRVDKTKETLNLNLLDLITELQPDDFMRISNTSIVNVREVLGFSTEDDFTVIMRNPIMANGQQDYHKGDEIKLIGKIDLKPELLRRMALHGIFIERR